MTDTSSPQWSLDAELQRVAEVDDIAQAVHALGLISRPESRYRLLGSDGEWFRGGAETYLFRFQVDEEGKENKDVLIKACVAFAPGVNLGDILDRWILRRNLLREHGVETPRLYGYGHGVLIEEYIPFTLSEAFASATSSRKKLLSGLAVYAAALSKLGFAPIEAFRDLRSRGRDVVAIDFGEDIGPAQAKAETRSELFGMLTAFIRELGADLNDTEIYELQAIFTAHEGELLH